MAGQTNPPSDIPAVRADIVRTRALPTMAAILLQGTEGPGDHHHGYLARLVLTIAAPAPWINSNQRLHRMVQAQRTADWRAAARTIVETGPGQWARSGPLLDRPVRVVARVFKARGGRYDPGNLYPTAKAVLDGFTDAGLWVDDDHTHVVGPDMRHGGKGPARLELTITPCLEGDDR